MKNVRAKFFVKSIQNFQNSPGKEYENSHAEITLGAVYGEENKSWSQHTPQGEIVMTITNQAAIDQFELGKSYHVDFTPSED